MINFKSFLLELRKPKEVEQFKKAVADIKDVDARDVSWQFTLPELMSKFGFKQLGSGKYAAVFGHDKYPFVLKVFMKDAAYFRWMKFIQTNRANPFLPKIKGKVVKITDIFNATRIEKLTPYNPSAKSSKEFISEFSKWKSDNSYKSSNSDIQTILEDFKKNKKLIDIHGDNLMMRGDQLVIIDPYYNWYVPSEKRFTIDPNEVNTDIF